VTNSAEMNGQRIGPGYLTYIIAEMSANHNRSFDKAVKIIDTAKNARASAASVQTFTPDTHTRQSAKEY